MDSLSPQTSRGSSEKVRDTVVGVKVHTLSSVRRDAVLCEKLQMKNIRDHKGTRIASCNLEISFTKSRCFLLELLVLVQNDKGKIVITFFSQRLENTHSVRVVHLIHAYPTVYLFFYFTSVFNDHIFLFE